MNILNQTNTNIIYVKIKSGFFSSRKATLLNHIFSRRENKAFVMVNNDMTEINIDDELSTTSVSPFNIMKEITLTHIGRLNNA